MIENRDRIAGAVYVEKLGKWRITLLPGVLLKARHVLMLTGGADKAEAVRNVFEAPYDPSRFPAQLIAHHHRHVTWFIDEAAASLASV
jgi:6-phosphogluconolactonase